MTQDTRRTFATKAQVYSNRPEWPDSIYVRLLEKNGFDPRNAAQMKDLVAVDIGAGTGKTTFPLAKLGCTVIAVEPNDEMRQKLQQTCRDQGYTNVIVTGGDAFSPDIPAEYKGRIRLFYSGNSAHWWSSRLPGNPPGQELRAAKKWAEFAHPDARAAIMYLRSAETSPVVLSLHDLVVDTLPETKGAPTELGSTYLFEYAAFKDYFNARAKKPEVHYEEIIFQLRDFRHFKEWLTSLSYFPDAAFQNPEVEKKFSDFFNTLVKKEIPFGMRLYTGVLNAGKTLIPPAKPGNDR